jgi:hypothetical protein
MIPVYVVKRKNAKISRSLSIWVEVRRNINQFILNNYNFLGVWFDKMNNCFFSVHTWKKLWQEIFMFLSPVLIAQYMRPIHSSVNVLCLCIVCALITTNIFNCPLYSSKFSACYARYAGWQGLHVLSSRILIGTVRDTFEHTSIVSSH